MKRKPRHNDKYVEGCLMGSIGYLRDILNGTHPYCEYEWDFVIKSINISIQYIENTLNESEEDSCN